MHYKIAVYVDDKSSFAYFCNNIKEVEEIINEWTNPEKGYRRFRNLEVIRNGFLFKSLCWTNEGLERKNYE